MTTNNRSVARLQKLGLSENTATHLAGKGIVSAIQLATKSTRELQELLTGADMGNDTIYTIKKKAMVMKALIDNHLVTVRNQVSPIYKALASTNVNNNIINFHEGMESYPELFGNLTYASDQEFDSMISPAAYLVDLMRYIDEYIEQPSQEEYKALLLKSRRPDIWNIPLDTENTVEEIPYLQLVNEILQTKLDAEGKVMPDGTINENDPIGNALQFMAETIFPFNLPFNAPLEKIRKYLEALETALYDVYKTFNIDPEAQTREYLKLSPEQVTYFTTPLPDADSLNLAFGNIKTDNPRPHFTGIISNTNLGSLTNAEVFMNQVGFTQTSQLEDLFYQNINQKLPGSNTLLNNLFINKSSPGYHLAYSPAETAGPNWADLDIWEDVSYYSTIQRVTAGGELYVLVRTKEGIATWQYNRAHQNWVQLQASMPAWSDENHWGQERYYSTIQAVVMDSDVFTPVHIYLFGRHEDGIQVYKFNTQTHVWTKVNHFGNWPDWSDLNWSTPDRYRTIKTAAVGDYIYITGRQPNGMETWYLDTKNGDAWQQVVTGTGSKDPDFTDANGWTDPSRYLTIQVICYRDQFFLFGRGHDGLETFVLYYLAGLPMWGSADLIPPWNDGNVWSQPCHYLTIQVFKADNTLYALASADDGIEVFYLAFDVGPVIEWFLIIATDVPNWVPADWQDPSRYLTIRASAFGKNIGLVARSASGIQTWELAIVTFLGVWVQVDTNSPAWSDAAGWNDPAYYTTIHKAALNHTPLLLGFTKTAIDSWSFDLQKNRWVKNTLVKAIIELENSTTYALLNMSVLDRVNRFIRLSAVLGWQYANLDWALTAIGAEDITTDAIRELKNLQWIMDTLQLPVWQATSFWHDIKTYGEGNSPVSQTPFDIAFNQPLPFYKEGLRILNDPSSALYHPLYAPNPNYQDQPVVWLTDGKSTASHAIIIRLMAALNLDARNLKALIDYLKGTSIYSDPNTIILGVENLSVLYRYALLANALKLSITELVILLQFLQFNQPLLFSSTDVIRIITCNQWMMENNLTADQLNYICNNILNKFIDRGFDLEKVPGLLKSLSEAAAQWYLNAKQLQSDNLVTEPISHSFYNTLADHGYIDDRGIMLINDFGFADVSDLFVCDTMSFADQQQLRSVCKVGNINNGTPSQVSIHFDPVIGSGPELLLNGSVCFWFKYDGIQTGSCTLYSLTPADKPANVIKVQITNRNVVLTAPNQKNKILYNLPAISGWHFLVISFHEKLTSLDNLEPVTNLQGLNILPFTQYTLAMGESDDAFITEVAELRLFDTSVAAADIVQQLYPSATDAQDAIKGNTNYWPLNEGQGIQTAKDVVGDLNGHYTLAMVWSINYNTIIPAGFSYLNAQGNLTAEFDPANNTPGNQPFIVLWKTIVNLRNILNTTISAQKQGTLQKLGDYYQVNRNMGVYASYIADKDKFSHYIQTLLAYRFSLNWVEFSLDLDRSTPFISPYLVSQFAANNIIIEETATITRLTDQDGHATGKWLLHESPDDIYFLNKREEALDIYKLLPALPAGVFADDDSFPVAEKYSDYRKFNIDKTYQPNRPALYFSTTGNQFAALVKKGDEVYVAVYESPGSDQDIVAQINTFISDLGQLLFTVKTLRLSDDEFKCVVDNKERFFTDAEKTTAGIFSLSQIKALALFKKLNNAYVAEDKSFAQYFYQPDDTGSLINYIAALTGWDAQGLRQLSQWNCSYEQFAAIRPQGSINPSPTSVHAGNNYAIAGYPTSNVVLVYQLQGELWEELPRIPTPTGAGSFGAAATIEHIAGNNQEILRAVIADPLANSGAGIVYVYEYNRNKKEWEQPVTLTAPGAAAGASFGSAVAVYENRLAIGAVHAQNKNGASKSGNVYIFEYAANQWTNKNVNFAVPGQDTLFGNSISLYDDIITIGSAGNAYIFRIAGSTAVPVIQPVPCAAAQVVTNGNFVVMSAMTVTNPTIQYITDASSPAPSAPATLINPLFKGLCNIAIEDDSLVVNDTTNTCYIYYIQDNILSYRTLIEPAPEARNVTQPWPVALADGNLVIGATDGSNPLLFFYGTRHTIHWFGFAHGCFSLANKLSVSIGSLLGFIGLAHVKLDVRSTVDLPPASANNNREAWEAYNSYANKLASALSIGHSGDEWTTMYNPLRNKFMERERDALAGYMIFSLRNQFTDISGINDLYELLLIDAGSAGSRTISRIKAALNSLQLYIERCRMQLEPYTFIRGDNDAADAATVEWSWMSHFRIWQANREVFLFPEKYFDPTLRKDKTDAYADLENKLSQSHLTNDSAVEAFQSYFHDLETLTGLTVVSTCMGCIASFINGRIIIKNTWYIFAKTKNRNEGYYYRTAEAILPDDLPDTWFEWTNWETINISIRSDSASCIYANGRPYLFWVDFTKQQVTGNDKTFASNKYFIYEATIFYSFQNANAKWSNPHEIPTSGDELSFSIVPKSDNIQVTLPNKPEVLVINPFLGMANLSLTITVKDDNVIYLTKTVDIDAILNLNERYIWPFIENAGDARNSYVLGTGGGVTYAAGTDLFRGRNVMNLDNYTKGYMLPDHFNSWFNYSFTLGIWVNAVFPTGNAGYYPIFYPSAAGSAQFNFQVINGYPSFGAGAQVIKSKTQLLNNAWNFVVFRFDAKTQEQSIFINGVSDQRAFNTNDLQGNVQYNFAYNGTQHASGNMADMFLTQAAMADTEILSIYKQYINFEISDDVENYVWELDGSFDEAEHDKKQLLLPSSSTVTFTEATSGPFANGRKVLQLADTVTPPQYVTLPRYFNGFFNHSFTIGIWVNGYFPTNGDWPILASTGTAPVETFCVLIRNGKAFMEFSDSNTTGKNAISWNNWHFVVFTYDESSGTQSIYLDGLPDNSSPGHLSYRGSSTLQLGLYNNVHTVGMLANFFLVNKALSAAEVLQLSKAPASVNNLVFVTENTDALNIIQQVNGRRIQQMNEDLFIGGADYLYGKNSVNISASDLSAKAPYGKYMWELYYHNPMLVARLLSSNNQFADAKRWYEYIFNPAAADKSHDRFWQLGYFRSLGKPEDLVTILTDNSPKDKDQVLLYDLDPFDPEAIAYLRPGAFEKKTVISYIRNLMNWGDSLFSQYTWETITQAEMLYILAKELLGKRPDIAGSFVQRKPMTFEEIDTEYEGDIPQFVIDIEDMQPAIHAQVQMTPRLSASVANFYFGIPENDELPALQDLIDTRLFEIRNGLNILGQAQSLALFEPPVNPMALVAARAAGLTAADVPAGYAADIPNFRFSRMIAYATSVTDRVVDFGRQILAALEKNDEEQLAMLRIVQERTILDLTTSIKQKEIEEAMNQGLVLDQSLASANERVAFYTRMLAQPISDLEAKSLQFNQTAINIEIPATGLHVAAVVANLIPTVFGFADGDFSPGGSVESAAAALSSGSSIANNFANMTAVSASFSRRSEDWELQLKLAQDDVASINIQKTINTLQVQNAQSDMAVQQQNITNNDNLQRFYTDKFTNREMYQWMIDQVSSVYYQAFQMALDLAKKAQAAYQFELNTNESIITYGYWNDSRRGLLAGEKLAADLNRLEKSFMDNNIRYLEIQKIVSLKELSVTELDKLIKTGNCRISLTEQLYDWDFPGHYNRKIKSVFIAIPAILGPYQTIKATLVQQSNKVVTRPDLNTVKYLVSKEKQQPPANVLRINWRPNQQVAISKAGGDSGLFELNFNDDRYLPFEGTGAISEWQLSIPPATNAFDLNTISDVIMYINYTAQDGGVEFAQQVINLPEIKNYKGLQVISIRQQFNQAWNTFMTKGSATFSVADLPWPANLQLPVHMDQQHITKVYRTINGNTDGIDVILQFDQPGPYDWKITFTDDQKRSELLDIILEIPYSAVLK